MKTICDNCEFLKINKSILFDGQILLDGKFKLGKQFYECLKNKFSKNPYPPFMNLSECNLNKNRKKELDEN